MKIDTTCVQGAKDKNNLTGSISVPIYQSAAFAHPAVGKSTGYDYSRTQNPTREALENVVAKLKCAAGAIAFSTGMAAMATLMELFSPGSHIIATDDLYGGSIRLFDKISAKNGLVFDYVDTNDIPAIKSKIKKNTKAIFIETPTNPMMKVTDIAKVAELAENTDILLIVDNTFLTPYLQQPLTLGADIVVHSGTKYLGGHNDTLAGFLAVANAEIGEKLRFIHKTIGACLSPFDSFLIIRGIKTLAIRMEKAQENAKALADWLPRQKKVTKVYYPGTGAMISFSVESEHIACQIIESVKIVMFAESLGGVETLITYPMLQTHADVPNEDRLARGIDEKLLRMSVGIENVEDLIEDLEKAINN
ncbi:MAG: aminotransferase class I/II-fold pyridoxal phosphate-dependent enzyme [Chitinispirillales bacterium]|jgi:cystathionine gamma-synthase|nr:aminotransferase class I/II-fold pyridoxal phosphate-dependent enzyme [Chitinispirillales bacterium]